MRGRQGTARGRAGSGRGRRLAAGCVGVAVVLGGVLPGQQAAAAGGFRSGPGDAGSSGTPGTYAFAEDARRVDGAMSPADAVELEPGRSYRSTLPATGTVHYRLELDDTTNLYASATVVPPPGRGTSVIDGVRVSVRDSEGRSCDADTSSLGSGGSPHPVAAWAMREISPRRSPCDDAGTYYLAVERAAPEAKGASPDPWEMELTTVSEPALEGTGPTRAPGEWNSAPPEPVTGQPERRAGGAGFTEATAVGQGVWRDGIRPGQTLFYKVPVDWGQQLYATVDLGGPGPAGGGFAAAALDLDLYNPARGHVEDLGMSYNGEPKSKSLAPLPEVAHGNRLDPGRQTGVMRFAGSYYLVAHLTAEVADDFGDGPVPLTLRIRVSGAVQEGPRYAGQTVPADVFTVTGEDRDAAAGGGTAGDGAAYRSLALGGIGTGSALLAWLGVWTMVVRRRARP
ncbi:hypothetical protein HTV45_12800 [Streptomyces sp. CHD11]|uniref:hypothetical protein n=1 Tax=Streptomyces sp. CHD11 TaxID=2741325 RepID=UPI001BFC10AA|nr:hypothetical protein [Streptomyces sp. CHD11]MBT3151754.1 hypothetical protein [Streptomyces sp. CHD11]